MLYICVRYKKDLVNALERESALERAKVQADLDWQRRCEELERLNYQRSEDLVKNLTKSRDEVNLFSLFCLSVPFLFV